MTTPLSYTQFQEKTYRPKKDEFGGSIGPRTYKEWKNTANVPGEGHDVTVSMPLDAAKAVGRTGAIKNVFQLSRANREEHRGESYLEKSTEKVLLGIPVNAPSTKRPVYGHLHETGDTGEGAMYGRAHLDLWPGSNHLTTTAGDSMDTLTEEHGGHTLKAGNIPRAEAWKSTQFDDLKPEHKDPKLWGDYREVQVHGPVPASHIQRARIEQEVNWEQPSLITKDAISFTGPSGREHTYPGNEPMTRGEQFKAGLPREWEANGGPKQPARPQPYPYGRL